MFVKIQNEKYWEKMFLFFKKGFFKDCGIIHHEWVLAFYIFNNG